MSNKSYSSITFSKTYKHSMGHRENDSPSEDDTIKTALEDYLPPQNLGSTMLHFADGHLHRIKLSNSPGNNAGTYERVIEIHVEPPSETLPSDLEDMIQNHGFVRVQEPVATSAT